MASANGASRDFFVVASMVEYPVNFRDKVLFKWNGNPIYKLSKAWCKLLKINHKVVYKKRVFAEMKQYQTVEESVIPYILINLTWSHNINEIVIR
jgi:hypothetical protein